MAEERIFCSFCGCWRTTVQPYTDGWSGLAAWGPGIPDGWYCKPHADALEALSDSGELEAAYQSRMKGKHPPPIVGAYFQTLGGDVLREYDDNTIKQIEGAW